MKTAEFDELELIDILDHISDLRNISDKISAVYADVYEYVSECDSKAHENDNEAKYLIYADIVSEYLDALKGGIDDLLNKIDKRGI